MKHSPILIFLALIFLSACTKDSQLTEHSEEGLSVQASTQAYDPFSVQSVVLNSHSVYGPMVLSDSDVDLPAAQGGGIVWNGPWVDGCGPYPCGPDVIGHCRGKETVCFVVVDAAGIVANIFQGEGLNVGAYNSPAVLIRTYMDHSDMVLVDNFANTSTGLHQANLIKAVQ